MSLWCCSHHAMRISKLPLEQWAGEIAKLPEGCEKGCGAPASCRARNADYLRVQYRALKRRIERESRGPGKQGALL
ncbi:TPA: hypothetical protein ACOFDH_000481 [Stenotrophomonas maltophilia]